MESGKSGMGDKELRHPDRDMWFLFGAQHAEMPGLASLFSDLYAQSKHPTDY